MVRLMPQISTDMQESIVVKTVILNRVVSLKFYKIFSMILVTDDEQIRHDFKMNQSAK